MTSLGTYYVSIVPSLRGAARQIESELSGVNASGIGDNIGRNLSRSVGSATNFQVVGQKLQGLGNQMTSVGSRLTRGITVPIGGAAVAAGGLVAALGWGRLTSVDTAQAQLRGLGYETSDVERISGQLTDALEGGMLTMGEATSAAAAGMAAGVEEGQELTRYIQLLDAATAGSNGTFDEMNQIFARIQGSGQLMTNEMQMIEQRMPGFSGAAAEHFGVTMDEFQNMVSAGEVSADDFLDIMDGFAGDMATEYAKSWEGMVQNTKAYIGILGENLLGGVFEQSKDAIAEFLEYLSSDEVQQWAVEAGEAIGEAFSRILELVREAIDWWMNLDGETKNLILSIAGLAVAAGPVLMVVGKILTVIGGLVAGFGQVVSWVSQVAARFGLASGASGAGGFLSVLMRFAGPIGLAISALMAMWNHSEGFREAIGNLFTTIWDGAQRVWEALVPVAEKIGEAFTLLMDGPLGSFVGFIMDVLEPMFIGLVDAVTIAFDTIFSVVEHVLGMIEGYLDFWIGVLTGDWERAWGGLEQIVDSGLNIIMSIIEGVLGIITSIISGVIDGWRVVFDTVMGAIQGVISGAWAAIQAIVRGAVNGVRSVISSVFNAIRALITTYVNGWRTIISTVWSAIQSVVSSAVNAVQSVVSSVFGAVRNFISTVWSGIQSAVSTAVGAVQSVVSGAFNMVRSVVTSVMNTVRSIVTGAWNAVRSGASNAVNAMRASVSNAFRAVTSTIRNLPSTIRGVFSNAFQWLQSAGRNIINGLTKGIQSAISGAVNAVRGGVQRIRNLLPFSPAKEGPLSGSGYTLYSGEALIEDFGKGIAGASPSAIRAMSETAERIAKESDISAAIPDFMPESWSASHPSAASVPSPSGVPADALVGAGARSGGDGGSKIEVGQLVVREEADIRRVAVELDKLQKRDRRGD